MIELNQKEWQAIEKVLTSSYPYGVDNGRDKTYVKFARHCAYIRDRMAFQFERKKDEPVTLGSQEAASLFKCLVLLLKFRLEDQVEIDVLDLIAFSKEDKDALQKDKAVCDSVLKILHKLLVESRP